MVGDRVDIEAEIEAVKQVAQIAIGEGLVWPTMIGAVATELFILGASPVPPAILLLAAAVVFMIRRHELFAA